MPGQCYLVGLCFLLEIFREDNLVNGRPILRLLLQTLLDDFIEIFCYSLRNDFVLLR